MKYLTSAFAVTIMVFAFSAQAISFHSGGTNTSVGKGVSNEVVNCGGSCGCIPQDRQDATCESFGSGTLTCIRCTVSSSTATPGSRCDRGWTGEVCSATMSEEEATDEAGRRAWRNCQGLQCLALQAGEEITRRLLRADPETFDVEQFLEDLSISKQPAN